MVKIVFVLIILSDFRGDPLQRIHISQIERENELLDRQCCDHGTFCPDPLAKLVMEKWLSKLDDIYRRIDIDPIALIRVVGKENSISMAKHSRPYSKQPPGLFTSGLTFHVGEQIG